MFRPSGSRIAFESLEPRFLLSGAMIVTSEALGGAFQDVAEWYTRKGYAAEVVTIESIDANYGGADRQERIRNCIRDYHENNDVLYVLLGGDSSIVPDRDTAGSGNQNAPTDLYYSSLTGQWDADADGVFGEANGDNVSFDYDTIVARYPVRTAAQVRTLLAKVKAYETAPPQADWATDMLAVGNKLWNPGDAEQKSMKADATYVSDNWADRDLDVFFDTHASWDSAAPGDHTLNAQNLLSAMGNGYQFMHVAAHGSSSSWALESGGFYSSTISGMTGSVNVPIVSTIACDTGAFDRSDPSLSEAFLRSDSTGTIIYLGASREGWGIPGQWLGPSFQYSYEFYREFLTGQSQIAGEVFAEMKANFGWKSGYEGASRWLQFGINFQGDPLVQMYRDDPVMLDPTFEAEITAGTQTYEVNGVPAGARVVLWQDGDVYVVGTADESGAFEAKVFPQAGQMKLTVVAPDAAVFTDEVAVVQLEDTTQHVTDKVVVGLGSPVMEEYLVDTVSIEAAQPIAAVIPIDYAAAAAAFGETAGSDAATALTVRTDVEVPAPARSSNVEGRLDGPAASQPAENDHASARTAPEAGITAALSARRLPVVDNSDATGSSDVLVTAETTPSVDLSSGWDLEGGPRRFTV